MDRHNKKRLLIINIFFMLLAIVITAVWFKDKYLFATAEEGMPFYSLSKTITVVSDVVYDNGTDFINPLVLSQIPFYYVSKLLSLFLSGHAVQFIVFTLLIFTATYGIYVLARELNLSQPASVISGIFYLLNLFTMSQVWRRSVYSGIIVWAFLPIFLVLWIKWVNKGSYKILIILLVSSVLFSHIYSQPAFIFTTWFPAFLYTLYGIYKKKRFIINRSILAFLMWVTINIWWIYPFLTISNPSLDRTVVSDKSLESLQGVSVSFPMSEIVLLKQKAYFDSSYNPQIPQLSWGTWYEGDLPKFISYGIFLITIFGWWNLRKSKHWIYLSIFALIGLFVSKGTNPPLGYIFFKNLFYNISFSQVLRNSYEKFGLVWLLPYSLFFGSGVSSLYNKIKNKYASALTLSVFIIVTMGMLVWPVWTGKLFEGYSWVKVPGYYEELNKYIKSDTGDFRIAVLPMLPSHGVALSWGYRGDDPGIFLYDKPVISRRIIYPYYTEMFDQLKSDFDSGIVNNRMLNELNVKYVVLNKDIRWDLVGTIPIDKTEEYLNNSGNLEHIKDFGNLKLYKNPDFNSSLISVEGVNPLKYEYKKVGNNKYEIYLSHVDAPYKLILKSNYSDFWKASVDNKLITDHHVEYGYANSWNIDKQGNHTIKLFFKTWPWD